MSTTNTLASRILLGLALCSTAPTLLAEPPDAAALPEVTQAQGHQVTTFHSIGLYWIPPGAPAQPPAQGLVKIQFAKTTDTAWTIGHDLWYDGRPAPGRPAEARGSVVQLEQGTPYVVKFGTLINPAGSKDDPNNIQWVAKIHATTWTGTDAFPIASRADDLTWKGTRGPAAVDFSSSNYPAGGSRTGTRRHLLHVTRSGSAQTGYVLYDFTGLNAVGNALQQDTSTNPPTPFNNADDFCAVISADYVIVRGLRCVGGGRGSMWIDPGHNHIVIEDCDISQWDQRWAPGNGVFFTIGDRNTDPSGTQYIRAVEEGEAGIVIQPDDHAYGSAPTSNVVVQRCRIHNPLYGTNPWEFDHPLGPSGILMYPTGGNHVIRYNEFYSTKPNADGSDSGYAGPPNYGHFFEDVAFLGGKNFDNVGSPGPDSDVYQNIIMHGMDDGLEIEGGGMNVRVWGNYIDYTATGLASTPVVIGPVYFWRNVYNRSRARYDAGWGADIQTGTGRLGFFKAGSDPNFGGGRRYIYNNTALEFPNPNGQPCDSTAAGCPLGEDYAINGTSDRDAAGNVIQQPVTNTVSRNNIFANAKPFAHQVINIGHTTPDANDFDYDVSNVSSTSSAMGDWVDSSNVDHPFNETHGQIGNPIVYKATNGPVAEWRGLYQLDTTSPGYHNGIPIANFNDLPAGTVDRGAHQSDTSPMLFGLAAAAAPAVSVDLDAASDSGPSNTDNITNDSTPTFTGSASAGSTVQIFDGAALVGSGTAAADGTYSITTSVLSEGSHTITAKVGTVQSQGVAVTIDTQAPASATITAPTNGSTVSGPVTISATTDASGVFGVQFKVNGNPLAGEDTGSPYSTVWDTSTVADGTYSLTATARDAAGNSVTSSVVSVVVHNGGGTVTLPGAGLTIEGTAVTTFHSIGLYWVPHLPNQGPSVPAGNVVKIRYAKVTDTAWKDGHDLWYDGRALGGRPAEARGSIVLLEANTQYIVQFGMPVGGGVTWTAEIRPTTWSETFPIGVSADSETWSGTKTTFTTSTFPAGGSRSGNARRHILLINQSGTASGYRLYDFTGKNAVGKPLQVDQNGVPFNNAADFCVVISADYVIVRGLRCIGGGEASIWIDPGHHDIVIEDVNLSDWAQKWADPSTAPRVQILDPETNPTGATGLRGVVEGEAGVAIQPDAHAYGSAPTSRVIVQRSKIHHPLYGANSWEFGHPLGPTGILMYPTGGNHVIRYNEFYSTKNKADGSDGDYTDAPDYLRFFEDVAVLGGTNFDNVGSPGPDTDIYQNIIMHGMDDGLEAEGGGMNVRVWGNYFDYTATGPASTSVTLGPLYLFRNVYNRSRSRYNNPWGQESDRLGFFKAGSDSIFGGGRRYVYHNTALQYPNPHFTTGDCNTSNPIHCPLGMDYGISDAGTDNGTVGVTNTVSLNNILEGWKNWHTTINVGSGGNNSFDYDMANTDAPHFGVTEQNWKISTLAQYASGNGPLAVWTGKYRLQPNTPGYRDGFPIANFSDGFQGAKPDRGAQESTANDMLFGLAAAGMAAPDLADASDSGASSTDNITSANALTFTGSASAGSTVQILDGATVVGSGTAAANGTYSITTSVLADGSHTITAKAGTVQSQPLTVTVDTQAPASATITAPTNGSTVSGAVTISATTDAAGVFGVQFKLNGNSLNAEDTSSPYATSWDTTTVADGTYSLTATARDAAGNSVTSSTVSVAVSNGVPPLTPPGTPDLDAASDSGTSNTDNITKVTLPKFTGTATAGTTVNIYSDGVQVGSGTITNGAYSITLTTALAEGTRSITAKAINGTTTSAASGALGVAVDLTAPAVAISAPANSATVSGSIPVNATATDANGVAGVQFQLDGVALQPEDTAAPYSINWDTTTATNGSHTLTAVGRDVAGNIVTSSAVTVTVSNGNPELNVMVSPPNGTVSTATGEHLDVTVSAAVGLSSVNFYINNLLKATVTAAPFTFSWVTATENPGNYTLKVEATSGSSTLTETRPVTVLGQTCEIYANAQSVPQGGLLMLQGLCSGSKNVAEIQFSVDGITQSSDPSSSYTATLDTSGLAVGTRVVGATGKFTSPAGESRITRTINVTQPVLSVDLMPGPVVLYDEKITFTASINDGRQVKQIDFYLDGVFKAGTIVAPYQFTWTPSGIAELGRHTIAVYATDVSGNVVITTRDVLLTPHTCSVELGTSRYRQAGADTVHAGPHKVAQGQRISLRSECSAWVSVNRVEFYLNGALQSSLTDAPYAWSVDTSGLTVGQVYSVSTKGYLTNGLVSNDAVSVQIVAP